MICSRNLPGSGGFPKTIKAVTISLNKSDVLMPACYEGSITFELTKHSNATIKVGADTINLNTDQLRRIYVPFKLHDDKNDYYKDSTYGWWTE